MGSYINIFLVDLVLVTSVLTQAEELTASGVKAQVLGQSGKIRLWMEDEDGNKGPTTTITMDELKEYDTAGNVVGTGGNVKHSINSFASQSFTFSDIINMDVPETEIASSALGFSSTLDQLTSKIDVTLYIFKEDGTITLNSEETEVTAGQAKFNIKLSNWQFCGCQKGGQDETGDYVDFVMSFKTDGGSDEPSAESNDANAPKKFSLGAGSSVQLSSQIKVDGTWQAMPSGYPKMEERGGKQAFVVRFPKFTSEALYDPVMQLGGGVTKGVLSMALLVVCLLANLRLF